ncbi:MAG: HAD hydrolase-like protein [Candidatus Paceibacterota bacterium]
MNVENKKLVIFDFDGVLANTLEFSFKIHKDINGNLTWEKFQKFAMGDFHEEMRRSVEKESHIIPKNFYELYEKNLNEIGINEVLRATVSELRNNHKLAIVSSTSSSYISNFLEKEKILSYFNDILGQDVHTSKIVKINTLLERYKIIPNYAVFITDSLGDILEGNECKIKSIGVTWGIHGKETLKKGNPSAIIDDPRDLLETIQNVLKLDSNASHLSHGRNNIGEQ